MRPRSAETSEPHPYVYPDDSHGTIDSMPKNQNTGFCSFRRFSLSYILPCACRIGYTTDELRNLYPPIQFYCIYTAACNNTLWAPGLYTICSMLMVATGLMLLKLTIARIDPDVNPQPDLKILLLLTFCNSSDNPLNCYDFFQYNKIPALLHSGARHRKSRNFDQFLSIHKIYSIFLLLTLFCLYLINLICQLTHVIYQSAACDYNLRLFCFGLEQGLHILFRYHAVINHT